jgi:hypothetical protein
MKLLEKEMGCGEETGIFSIQPSNQPWIAARRAKRRTRNTSAFVPQMTRVAMRWILMIMKSFLSP